MQRMHHDYRCAIYQLRLRRHNGKGDKIRVQSVPVGTIRRMEIFPPPANPDLTNRSPELVNQSYESISINSAPLLLVHLMLITGSVSSSENITPNVRVNSD